jgi:hypothetical protein
LIIAKRTKEIRTCSGTLRTCNRSVNRVTRARPLKSTADLGAQ